MCIPCMHDCTLSIIIIIMVDVFLILKVYQLIPAYWQTQNQIIDYRKILEYPYWCNTSCDGAKTFSSALGFITHHRSHISKSVH